jgi:hypothetical protein
VTRKRGGERESERDKGGEGNSMYQQTLLDVKHLVLLSMIVGDLQRKKGSSI